MTFAQFHREIKNIEGELAHGGETSMFGDYVDRMTILGGVSFRESDAEIDAEEADWWRKAYAIYKADLALPDSKRATDVQDIYNRIEADTP